MENNKRVCFRKFDLRTLMTERADHDHNPKFKIFVYGFLSRTRYCNESELKALKVLVRFLARHKCEHTCDQAECNARRAKIYKK